MAKPPKPANRHKNTRELPEAMLAAQWKPGQSGNPSGRPKKQPLTEIYEEIFGDPDQREALKQAIIKTLLAGRMASVLTMKDAGDRLEGKPTQKVKLEGEIQVSLYDRLQSARKSKSA